MRINGATARTVEEMSDYLRVLWLTPAMDGLFTGPASDRRRFLDRLVTTLIPGHSASVADYETAMRQRNRLLADDADPRWLAALEAQLAIHAAAVHFARTDSLQHLQDADPRERRRRQLSRGPAGADAAVRRRAPRPPSSAALEATLRERWAATRGQDRAAGRTLLGPHRVDFEVSTPKSRCRRPSARPASRRRC